MAKNDAWALIEELAEHSTQDRFVYYHSWRVGDLLMWDERATMHRGAGDYEPSERRIMLRTIVYANYAPTFTKAPRSSVFFAAHSSAGCSGSRNCVSPPACSAIGTPSR
jgi:alpha-ketoglutarate-dependent 2,4-dichlorophenoxyacetate dioxygenase